MTDAVTRRFGWLGWGVAVAGWLLGSSGASLAATKLPDLVVTALTNPPASGLPGDSFTVTATIKNGGSATAPASTTKFSLLLKQDGTTTVDLKGVQALDALAAGDVKAPSATVAIAKGTPPGKYYLLACADGPGVITEAKENNNCRKTAETITVLSLPDLVVTAVSDPPPALAPGQSFKITSTVKNTGLVTAGAVTAQYSLVSTADATVTISLKNPVPVPSLAANQIFSDEETGTIPGGAESGEYRVQVCADSGKAVAEDDEADNCLLSAGTILVTTLADLRIGSATLVGAPVVVIPGGTFDVAAVARNAGVADAAASTITFALVNTAGTARPLTGAQAVPILGAGASTSTQTTVTVPLGTPFATYTVLVCIDAAGVVPEASDLNNCTSAPGTVKVVAVLQLKPDLVITDLTDAPLTVLPSATFTATATVKNQGAAASAASTTKFYLVSSADQSKKNLKGVDSVGALAVGATGGVAVTLKVFSDTVPGAYTLLACADGSGDVAESAENNNCVTMPRGVQVLESPDLQALGVSDPPPTATQGQNIDVTATFKNIGTVVATESTTRYYLVASDGSGKIDMKGKPTLPKIDPGKTFTEKDTMGVRSETTPGTYFLQACGDAKKVLAETNENNNCVTSVKTIAITERPDLIVTQVTLTDPQPISVPIGGTISVQFTVQNVGPGPAASSQMRIFLIDTKTGVSKDLKGHPSVDELAPTKSRNVNGTVKVFSDTKVGTYQIKACADYNEQVPEIDEDNNCEMAKGTLTVTPAVPVP